MAGYKSKKKSAEDKVSEWPKINKGSHLTVITHEDGSTELEWDDEALLRDVQEAIASVENVTEKPKRTRKKSNG